MKPLVHYNPIVASPSGQCVITIGNFDGVHRGHQRIVAMARRIASQQGLPVVAMTFDPHPVTLLRPREAPPAIIPLAERERLLRASGADRVVVVHVTPQFLQVEAEDFLRQLAAEHAPVALVEGRAFRFGHNRRGDVAMIDRLGRELGFTAAPVDSVEVATLDQLMVPVSSSLVRWLVGHGRMMDAALCLGRPFTVTGTVARGEQRGRTIGVPTLNINAAELTGLIVPADGVYAGKVVIHNDASEQVQPPAIHPAAISVGVKPTFGRRQRVIEAHLLDVPAGLNVYGRTVTVRFIRWLRDQHAFPGIDALKAQIGRDIAYVRRLQAAGKLAHPSLTLDPTLRQSA
jgi:riboflavin kinase/FMN adenylyltransferase